MLYAKINKPGERVILHLMDIQTHGEETVPLASAAEVAAFVGSHPEIQAVMFYDSRYPRNAVPVSAVNERYVAKLFKRRS